VAANVVARVVDQNVDRPEIGRDRFEKPVDGRMVRHIELEGKSEWAKRSGQFGHGLAVYICERNARATLCERRADRLADPTSGAGHQSVAPA